MGVRERRRRGQGVRERRKREHGGIEGVREACIGV
jgi:hypothetical protein